MNKLTPPNRLVFAVLTMMLFRLIGHPSFADEPPPAVLLRERLQGC